jgi:Flp pilus assembly protein TadD
VTDPPSPDPLLNAQRARALYDSGSLAEAQSLYAGLLMSDPRNYESLHMLGVIAMRLGDPARAVELIGRAIGVEPRKAAAYCNRGLALERVGKQQAALADSIWPSRSILGFGAGTSTVPSCSELKVAWTTR